MSPGLIDIRSNSSNHQPFYLGSSSTDQTSNQFLTELEFNSSFPAYAHANFSGDNPEKLLDDDPHTTELYIQKAIKILSTDSPYLWSDAAAFICHITYKNPTIKQVVSDLDAIQALSALILSSHCDTKRHCVYALRNLSYEPSREIKKRLDEASVVSNLLKVLEEAVVPQEGPLSPIDDRTLESVAATLCNLAIHQEFRDSISQYGVPCLTKTIIIPYSGVGAPGQASASDSEHSVLTYEKLVFIYATGTVRNILDESGECRQRLREMPGLVAALTMTCLQCAENDDFESKALENCVCILRNLSFALQEVRDPAYLVRRETAYFVAATNAAPEPQRVVFAHHKNKGDYHPLNPFQTRPGLVMNLMKPSTPNIWMELGGPDYLARPPSNLECLQGGRLLWQANLIDNYISILRHCVNLTTLEATAGAVQNLTACDWEPSQEVRAQFRKADSILVLAALLISEDDNTVMTTATALRNLAEDPDTRSLVALYGMRLLIARLPVLQQQQQQHTMTTTSMKPKANVEEAGTGQIHKVVSLRTTAAILSALYVLTKEDAENASLFLDCGGVQPCLAIAHTGIYEDPLDPVPSNRDKAVRFARYLLQALWMHQDGLRDRLRRAGWRAAHFCVDEPVIRDTLRQAFHSRQDKNHEAADTIPPTKSPHLISAPQPAGPRDEHDVRLEHGDGLLIEYPDPGAHRLPLDALLLAPQRATPVMTTSGGRGSAASRNGQHPQRRFPAVASKDMSQACVAPQLNVHAESLPTLQVTDVASADRISLQHNAAPEKKGYLSHLNVPEVIAVSRREKPPERSVSPFLRPSASSVDLAAIATGSTLNIPGQPERQLSPTGSFVRTEIQPKQSAPNLQLPNIHSPSNSPYDPRKDFGIPRSQSTHFNHHHHHQHHSHLPSPSPPSPRPTPLPRVRPRQPINNTDAARVPVASTDQQVSTASSASSRRSRGYRFTVPPV